MTRAACALKAAQLTPEELERILQVCGSRALLVGGQALATWAAHYGIEPIGVLSESVTMDADFIGTKAVAQALHSSLGPPWKLRKGTIDDVGGQIAKVYATVPKHGLKQVDFLTGVVGLDTKTVRERAALLKLADGGTVQLLNPLDVLASRLHNLDSVPAKQNAIGVAQAALAVRVVRAFIEDHMDAGGDPRQVRKAVKAIEKLALDTRLSRVAFTYDLDVLAAIPVERIAYPRFHEEQWPRILARLDRKREKFIALQQRRTSLAAASKTREP